jgi:hypothetical protein
MLSFKIIIFASGNVFSRFNVFYVDFKSQMKLNFEGNRQKKLAGTWDRKKR